MSNPPGMNDKRILITGASKGLGAVAAGAFSEMGARLVLMARTSGLLEDVRRSCKNPELHEVLPVDFLNLEQLRDAVKNALDFLGQIDVVLHAAGGGLGYREDLVSADELYKLFLLNIGAAAEVNRLVVPQMKERREGRLVHVGSIASYEGVGSVGYNTMKSALAAYVRSLGRELNRFNIVVTGILPGGFISPGNAMARLEQANPGAYQKFIDDRLPRGVMGSAQELIPMLRLLCSEEASMMGGCLVPIDAGEGRSYWT